MCGIAGACWTVHGEPLSERTLRRMTTALVHRGPDDDGYFLAPSNETSQPSAGASGGVALGFRRLSIIDLEGGHQPLQNEDGTVWIVFNGEVYNYRELRPELESLGHVFRTASDTECIVHAYEQWGRQCVNRLRGMFAFAIWDARQQRLFLARDRMGQKPLVFRIAAGRILFASELKALLEVPGTPRDIDPFALADYVALQYVPHPKSILKGYQKLPPAHWAEFNARSGDLLVEQYWQAPFLRPRHERHLTDSFLESDGAFTSETEESLKKRLRETLTESVSLRMRSDVPFGAFLSGGVDSTIITGLMQQQSTERVKTFSIGFNVKEFDERSFAREAAKKLGTDHHEFVVDPSAVEMLPKLIWHFDEPFADSSAIPTMYLSQLTRRHVTVSLSGDGGDELFAGYDRYKAVELAGKIDRLPVMFRKLLANRMWQSIPTPVGQKSKLRKIKRLLAAIGQNPERRYSNWVSIFDDERRMSLFTREFTATLDGYDAASFLMERFARCAEPDFVQRTTCVDVESYLPCDILTKVDIASMAFSLEVRSPFMDHRVVELAARIPRALKLHHGRGKQILVDTFTDLLPDSIRLRPKMGFGVPLDHWFRGDVREFLADTLLAQNCLNRGFFEPSEVKRLLEEHLSSKWDHSGRLWSLLVFELWQQRFLDKSPCHTLDDVHRE